MDSRVLKLYTMHMAPLNVRCCPDIFWPIEWSTLWPRSIYLHMCIMQWKRHLKNVDIVKIEAFYIKHQWFNECSDFKYVSTVIWNFCAYFLLAIPWASQNNQVWKRDSPHLCHKQMLTDSESIVIWGIMRQLVDCWKWVNDSGWWWLPRGSTPGEIYDLTLCIGVQNERTPPSQGERLEGITPPPPEEAGGIRSKCFF